MPDGFRPVIYADGKRGAVALLTLESEGVTARQRLNDTEAMTLGTTGTVILEGMRTGKNDLQVDFRGVAWSRVEVLHRHSRRIPIRHPTTRRRRRIHGEGDIRRPVKWADHRCRRLQHRNLGARRADKPLASAPDRDVAFERSDLLRSADFQKSKARWAWPLVKTKGTPCQQNILARRVD